MRTARATDATLRPHDLLWIGDPHDVRSTSPVPAWATRKWLTLAPVVVRRETVIDDGLVPVGLRGHERSQRFAACVPRARIRRHVTPESLAQARAWRRHAGFAKLPCVSALNRVAPELDRLQLTWGITGSVGFAFQAASAHCDRTATSICCCAPRSRCLATMRARFFLFFRLLPHASTCRSIPATPALRSPNGRGSQTACC
jgi:hypothetical protein